MSEGVVSRRQFSWTDLQPSAHESDKLWEALTIPCQFRVPHKADVLYGRILRQNFSQRAQVIVYQGHCRRISRCDSPAMAASKGTDVQSTQSRRDRKYEQQVIWRHIGRRYGQLI